MMKEKMSRVKIRGVSSEDGFGDAVRDFVEVSQILIPSSIVITAAAVAGRLSRAMAAFIHIHPPPLSLSSL